MRKIVVVDIDGTVSKVGDRLKYLKRDKPNWDRFYDSCFEDQPIQEVIDLVKVLEKDYEIVYCTGRRESVRGVTQTWLLDRGLMVGKLLMRPDGDKRHDTDVKPEQLSNEGILLQEIAFVLEDRDSMVKKWRGLGLKCLQVDYGDF